MKSVPFHLAVFIVYFFGGLWIQDLATPFGPVAESLLWLLWGVSLFFAVGGATFKKLSHKMRSFARGASLGLILVLFLIGFNLTSGSVVIRKVKLDPALITYTSSVALIIAASYAISIELILRGYLVNKFSGLWGNHTSVWSAAVLVGLACLIFTPISAYTAFIASLMLGYGFLWHGLHYSMGALFSWLYVSILFYSNTFIRYHLIDAALVGDKFQSPVYEGLLALAVLMIGFAVMLLTHKTEWFLDHSGNGR